MSLIEVEHIVKTFRIPKAGKGLGGAVKSLFHREYEEKKAVDDISFTLEKGDMVGYIGPNGAGKSTTIKMLAGILTPDSGIVRVGGLIPSKQRKENARQIGVVFGQRSQLYWDLPVSDTFELYQKLYSIPIDTWKRSRDRLIDLLEMRDFLSQPVRQLSLGQKMKANLALAMLHEPPVLYLDEPTIGLDVMTKQRLRVGIRRINRECGATVMLTTHDMKDIEEICDRIILIDHGRKLFDGTLSHFKESYRRGASYKLEFETPPQWKPQEGFTCEVKENTWIVRTVQPYDKTVLMSLIEAYNPTSIYTEETSVEDIVSQIFS